MTDQRALAFSGLQRSHLDRLDIDWPVYMSHLRQLEKKAVQCQSSSVENYSVTQRHSVTASQRHHSGTALQWHNGTASRYIITVSQWHSVTVAQCLLLLLFLHRRRQQQKKRIWVRRINHHREKKGEYNSLINEMRLFDHESFYKYFRMTPSRFDHLLSLIGPCITKESTTFRNSDI